MSLMPPVRARLRQAFFASPLLRDAFRLGTALLQAAAPESAIEKRFKSALAAAQAVGSRCPPPIPKRIALVNSSLVPGGAERQVVNTLLGLSRRPSSIESARLLLGGEATARPNGRFYLRELETAGIHVDVVPPAISISDQDVPTDEGRVAERIFGLLPNRDARQALGWWLALRRFRPSIVHAWQDSTCIAIGLAALLTGADRIVLGTRNINPTHFLYWRPYMRPAWRALLRQPKVRFVNNSTAGAESYCRWFGISVASATVIRNGIRVLPRPAGFTTDARARLRRDLSLPAHMPVIGGIFRLYPEKRPELWIRTAAEIVRVRSDAVFVLIGWGPMEARVRRYIAALGLDNRVHLMTLEPDDIGRLIAAFDVFLLTSEAEGTPNVLLEAQMLGVPVVATPGGGVSESLIDGTTGILARDETPAAIARGVLDMLQRGDDDAHTLTGGPAFVESRFGLERMIDETLAIYGLQPPTIGRAVDAAVPDS